MAIEEVRHLNDRTIVSILEPTHYGVPDDRWHVEISHSSPQLALITQEQLAKELSHAPFGLSNTMDQVEIPSVGTVVFINEYDNDYSSSTWRAGVHRVRGPFLLRDLL